MTTKTEDEIAREKEAVQKMVGAKSAMETAIKRIQRLEETIYSMVVLIDDVSGAFGETAMFSTYHHGDLGSEKKVTFIKRQMARIAQMGRDVK